VNVVLGMFTVNKVFGREVGVGMAYYFGSRHIIGT
jgi:hypothetical protein